MIQIPSDNPVQPLKDGEHVENEAQCGTCGLRWDFDKNPTPASRCAFEWFHEDKEPAQFFHCNGEGADLFYAVECNETSVFLHRLNGTPHGWERRSKLHLVSDRQVREVLRVHERIVRNIKEQLGE